MIEDGQGGAYVVFVDTPEIFYETLVMHFDGNGNTTWNNPINAIPSEEEISGRNQPCAVSDGSWDGVEWCYHPVKKGRLCVCFSYSPKELVSRLEGVPLPLESDI